MTERIKRERAFTREELERALPYHKAYFIVLTYITRGERGWYMPPRCPHCRNTLDDFSIGTCNLFGKYPRVMFKRCPACRGAYFRPDCQEPALIRKPLKVSYLKYVAALLILSELAVLVLLCYGFGGQGFAFFLLTLFPAAMCGVLMMYIKDMSTTDEEIRESMDNLNSVVYLEALKRRGVELPYYYLKKLEEAASKGDRSASSAEDAS
ncbi:MAG: hypothetical protein II922_08700 [Succinimonas sp.]|nr:hypothetical protein [Succinimonas sp.]